MFPPHIGAKYRPSPFKIEVPATLLCHQEFPERFEMVPEDATPVTPRTTVATFC